MCRANGSVRTLWQSLCLPTLAKTRMEKISLRLASLLVRRYCFRLDYYTRSAMSLQSVRDFFSTRHLDMPIIEFDVSTATVALAAEAHGVEPGRIAKTLVFRLNDGRVILLVARGDARIEHRKFKDAFGKGKMLPMDEVVELTGHPVGGVCPFGLAQALPLYLDQSLLDFDEVLPAAGAIHSAVHISPAQMAEVTEGQWVDVCQG